MNKLALILALAFAGFSLSADDVGPYFPGEWTWTDHNTWDICEYATIYDQQGAATSKYDGYYLINQDCTVTVKAFGFDTRDNAYVGFNFINGDISSNSESTETYHYQINEKDVKDENDVLIGEKGVDIALSKGDMVGLSAYKSGLFRVEDNAFGALGLWGRGDGGLLGDWGLTKSNEWYASPDGKTFTWYANSNKTEWFVLTVSGSPLPGPVTSLLLTALVAGGLFMIQRKGNFALVR